MQDMLHSSLLKLLLTGLLFFISLPNAHAKPWQYWARYTGPAEKKRPQAISELNKIENLDALLLKQLGTNNQGLALDVISALGKQDLIPQLIKKIPEDDSGFLILTLNALLSKSNYKSVLTKYKKMLETQSETLSAANIVALIEPMGRMGCAIEMSSLKTLIKHPYPEVRSAVLNYARTILVKYNKSGYFPLFKIASNDKTWQIRKQVETHLFEIKHNQVLSQKIPQPMLFDVKVDESRFRIVGKDLRVVFGYKDARPGRFVGDRHERLAFIQHLLLPCANQEDKGACGFRRHPKDQDLFLKRVFKENGEDTKVHLRVVHSSVDTDDRANRKNLFQNFQSQRAESLFLDGLSNADMVFYNGHSRFGGGPDFTPPHLNASGHVDSSFYSTHATGTQKMLNVLKRRKLEPDTPPLSTFGIFSCTSSQHFMKSIKDTGVSTVLTSRRLLHYTEALRDSLKALGLYLEKI